MKKLFPSHSITHKIIPIFLLLLAGVLLSYNLGKPFWGHHDFNNAFYGNMARNLVRLPLSETKLGQPTNSGLNPMLPLTFHTHHPPLLIWLLALSYLSFGISEWTTRLVPLLFSLGTLFYFYRFLKLNFSVRTAVAATIFWIISPLFIYFGKMAVHEILVVFFFVFSFYYYSLWILKENKSYLCLTIFGLIGGTLSGWAGFYSVLVILINYWLSKRRLDRLTIGLIVLPIVMFAFHLFQNYLQTGSIAGGGFGEVFLLRSSQIPLIEYLKKELSWMVTYFTKPIFLMAFFGLPFAWVKFLKARVIIISFLIFGVLHLILFRQAAFRHDYLIYYLLPLFSTLSALTLSLIPRSFFMNVTFLIIIILSVYTSFRFTGALEESNYDSDGVVAGRLIAEKTKPEDTVALVSPKIYNNSDWQVVFYGDRSLVIVPKFENAPVYVNWLVQDIGNSQFSFEHSYD